MMCECCTPRKFIGCGFFLLLLCASFIIVAIFVPPAIQNLLNEQILLQQRVVTSNNSKGFTDWQSNYYEGAPPQYLYVYPFNITNPEEVIQGAKPKLKQLGPYVYNWRWHYFDFTFSSDEEFVSFFKSESYFFNKELSTGDPYKDLGYFPSLPYAGLRGRVSPLPNDQWWKTLAFDILTGAATKNISKNQSPLINATVDEYIWGFDSEMLTWLNKTFASFLNQTINTKVQILVNSTTDEQTRKDKKQRDMMFTGKSDSRKLNQFTKYEGKSQLLYNGISVWGNNDSNTVYGSDGLGFDIDIKNYPPQQIFVDNILRHVQMVSNMTQNIQGIDMLLYFLNQSEFNNVTTNPAYNLYAPSGVSNMSVVNLVTQGSPISMVTSQPLFYGADPYYFNAVEFLPPITVPNVTEHNTFLWVEPYTGITMMARKRLQVNIQISRSFLYPNITSVFVPAIWFGQYAELSSSQATQWHSTVGVVVGVIKAVPIVGFILGGIMLLLSGSFFVMAYTSSRNDYERLTQKDSGIQN